MSSGVGVLVSFKHGTIELVQEAADRHGLTVAAWIEDVVLRALRDQDPQREER